MPFFTNRSDPQSAEVVARGCVLLWIAAGYQLFDVSTSPAARACAARAMSAFRPSWYLRYPGCSSCRWLTVCRSLRPRLGPLAAQFGLGAVGGWFAALAMSVAWG